MTEQNFNNLSREQQYALMQQQNAPPRTDSNIMNPFDSDVYKNVNLPDTPVQYGNSLAESLLNDNEVPEAIREKYWYIFHKDNILTFLDEDRKKSKLLNFDIMKIDMLNMTGYGDYTFEQEAKFNILRNVFETKLDRALGFKDNSQTNERKTLQSQFSESRMIQENSGMVKEGFFKRLLGRR
jgi:hypothetical protein